MERPKATAPPSRAEIENTLLDLIRGSITREQASDWAWPWWANDDIELDEVTDEIIDCIYAADLPSTDRPYLYQEIDFRSWLVRFRNAGV